MHQSRAITALAVICLLFAACLEEGYEEGYELDENAQEQTKTVTIEDAQSQVANGRGTIVTCPSPLYVRGNVKFDVSGGMSIAPGDQTKIYTDTTRVSRVLSNQSPYDLLICSSSSGAQETARGEPGYSCYRIDNGTSFYCEKD